ncbi:hypothetical protein SG09_35550 [Bradyrhizobium ottawaense]|nr:hypothetical protein SG09_35550 [Bradyrhizobium ottawaense]GMO46199.1 hypothetical protein BwSF21_62420 [Bradyrhizobium ottawaense]
MVQAEGFAPRSLHCSAIALIEDKNTDRRCFEWTNCSDPPRMIDISAAEFNPIGTRVWDSVLVKNAPIANAPKIIVFHTALMQIMAGNNGNMISQRGGHHGDGRGAFWAVCEEGRPLSGI